MPHFSERLVELGIELPEVATRGRLYSGKEDGRSGPHVGELPSFRAKLSVRGKVGDEVNAEQAYEQARIAALNALAAAVSVGGESLTVTHVTVFVASSPDFTAQPQVANGASDVLAEIFGSAGAHTRSAVGVAVLPLDSPVEVELVCQVDDE